MSNIQTIRLRGSAPKPATAASEDKPKLRHVGLLQDQVRRTARAPWCPNLLLAMRLLLLMRVAGAMYSNISDCDEVFNFWEPLHFADRGYGFQTWELSPAYAIRSWAYILLHLPFTWIPVRLLSMQKRHAFFSLRIAFAVASSFAEAKFYRAVVECINEHVGRYLLLMLLTSAGMWNASTAFLPSTFAMYTTMLATSYFVFPVALTSSRLPWTFPRVYQRTLFATLAFATGAVVGWPFSLLLAVPFVAEELLLRGADVLAAGGKPEWQRQRFARLLGCGLTAALVIVPVFAIDTVAYNRFVLTPLNIITYNIFGGSERGPDLYGTEPASFYILNLLLNFNTLALLALFSLPALAITYAHDNKRVEAGFIRIFHHALSNKAKAAGQSAPSQRELEVSSAYTMLAVRLAPFYLWLGVLSAQAHKEERFMFPAYPLLCFNAAVTLYLLRGLVERTFINITNSPYRASKTGLFGLFTSSVIVTSAVISISRILALNRYYHAPLSVAYHFEHEELPRLLNVTGLLPAYEGDEKERPPVDLSPVAQFNLSLCISKEWYRFPGHYLVPDGVSVLFVKSAFDGQLPRHFDEDAIGTSLASWAGLWKRLDVTRRVPADLNDLNKEELSRYVGALTCDYLVDLDFPSRPIVDPKEPRYSVQSETWDRVACRPFLDSARSPRLTRTLWLPGLAERSNQYGDYCLLRNRARASAREITRK
ncbi:glycosyltransferase family 22 protein [Auricularia subglabra TFB-10046 SS5]|nr:glycosyltransferase family 22 protein [Auricularia subglabra TFB-10046 SS5]